ncbi:hypothetical protein Q4577_08760 [Marinovum sp. 2_MG-2023]|uniref:hypothetical protein n=1 Tax=unclassified Marinovum TaxID=2647166 RepID=UPI0026E18E49|nr:MULTISPECIES: hypothetical protein [unclassified Marinovum]MDO6730107.1 hypothetical protein [Marinovum sp. 2_MG-2023]MDO6779921.1 hypothetical protein [Marinovum sp. 1_MG-2023]
MRQIFSTKKAAERKARLAVERKLFSAEFPGFKQTPGDIERHNESWVRMWVDNSFAVDSDCGLMMARRGLTEDGQIIWLITHVQRPLAFHAVGHDPAMAFDRARDAWSRCDALRLRSADIRALCRDLLMGRVRFDITVEDAAASPLSAVEVRSFMSRMGLSRRRRISGRMAALIALIEPQVGMVIWTAQQRQARRTADAEANDGAALA